MSFTAMHHIPQIIIYLECGCPVRTADLKKNKRKQQKDKKKQKNKTSQLDLLSEKQPVFGFLIGLLLQLKEDNFLIKKHFILQLIKNPLIWRSMFFSLDGKEIKHCSVESNP